MREIKTNTMILLGTSVGYLLLAIAIAIHSVSDKSDKNMLLMFILLFSGIIGSSTAHCLRAIQKKIEELDTKM
jgi:multisubunit Na+/H+ antiporter MnhG subunit